MRILGLLFFIVVVQFSSQLVAEEKPSFLTSADRIITVEEQIEDLDTLARVFSENHGGLYRYSSQVEFENMVNDIRERLVEPVSVIEFLRAIVPVIDVVKDAHTGIYPPDDFSRHFRNNGLIFPIIPFFREEKMFAERVLGENPKVLPGAEILEINGTPIQELLPLLLQGQATDGNIHTGKYRELELGFWREYPKLINHSEEYSIIFRNPGEETTQFLQLIPVNNGTRLNALSLRGRPPFTFEIFEDRNTAVIWIRHFLDDDTSEFFKNSFATIQEESIENLIIDIRDNGGGIDWYTAELIKYLTNKPFRLYLKPTFVATSFERLSPAEVDLDDFREAEISDVDWEGLVKEDLLSKFIEIFNENNKAKGVHVPYDNAFQGEVYILFNGGSVSSGGEIPAIMHHLGIATLIGEEPNGAYEGVTAGVTAELELPNSGIYVDIPLIAYNNAVFPGLFPGHGVAPYFEVKRNLEEVLRGKDTVMDFTLDLIQARKGKKP